MSPDTPGTVVSVTPMAIERDSRTFKQAASLARFGYRSIVVEGEASAPTKGLPFELVTIPGANPAWGADAGPTPGREDAAPEPDPVDPADAPAGPVGRFGLASEALAAAMRLRDRLRILWSTRTFFLRWHLNWNRRTYRSLPRADLYVVHHYSLSPAVIAKALRNRAPIVYDAHDAYFEVKPEQRTDPPGGQRTWELIERICVRRARAFATVSEGVAAMLEQRFGRRPAVIRNCHDLRLDRPAEISLRDRVDVPDNAFLLVSIGNWKDGMTTEEAISALREVPDAHLAFVGRGHERNRERIAQLGLTDRVHLVGPVPPTEVTSFVDSADAAIVLYRPLTGNYESALPNGFFQGVAAGLPTLYPAALPEVAAIAEAHELGVRIDPGDPDSIATAISDLRGNPERLGRLRESAGRAREAESWEHEEGLLVRLVDHARNGSLLRSPWARAGS